MALNAQVELGYMNKAREVVSMKTLMVKTEAQMQAIRASPEFLRCTQEEQLGRPLSEVCELVRHQAASVDEVKKLPLKFRIDLLSLYFLYMNLHCFSF